MLHIETDRLILRPFREADYDDLYEFLAQLRDSEFESYPDITYENGRQHLAYRLGSDEFLAIELKETGKVIGNIYFGSRDHRAKELGYIVNRDYQRRGYALEALTAATDHAFSAGIHRVYASCDPRNLCSRKLLEKAGFVREAHFRQNVCYRRTPNGDPIWKDTCVYARLNEAVKKETCKKLYFVRHGESLWNTEDRICGRTDSPLTEKGHLQAMETGERILASGIRADEILYSPLSRAKATALHISEITGIPAREEPRLTEQAFGKWEGTSPRNAEAFRLAKQQFLCDYTGGESMFRLAQRIYNLLDELKKDDKTYLLVAHNGIARVVKSYFENMTNEEYAAFGIPNCFVAEFEYVPGTPDDPA